MTVIAYRDGVLAGDTLVVAGEDMRFGEIEKIGRSGPVLFGAAGSLVLIQQFHSWVRSGLQGDNPFTDPPDGAGGEGLIIANGRVVYVARRGLCSPRAEIAAIGSGQDYAMGAMAAGASAEQAVMAAIQVCTTCGGDITVLKDESWTPRPSSRKSMPATRKRR